MPLAHTCENCRRMSVFCLDNRYLLLAQNSRSTAQRAEARRTEPHALQKQAIEGTLQHNDKDCVVASNSLTSCFPCVMGSIA